MLPITVQVSAWFGTDFIPLPPWRDDAGYIGAVTVCD
jgi:hypothetical protein